MKTLSVWTTAVALAACSGSALAVGPGPLGNIDNVPITISNTVPAGIFQDVYSFSLVDPGDLSGTVTAVDFGVYNILGLAVTLQDSTFAVIGTDNSPSNGFTFSGLSSGNYSLSVLGLANGLGGGFYAGGFVANTAPVAVPEPGTYALMMFGLGLVGFVVARRKSRA